MGALLLRRGSREERNGIGKGRGRKREEKGVKLGEERHRRSQVYSGFTCTPRVKKKLGVIYRENLKVHRPGRATVDFRTFLLGRGRFGGPEWFIW